MCGKHDDKWGTIDNIMAYRQFESLLQQQKHFNQFC